MRTTYEQRKRRYNPSAGRLQYRVSGPHPTGQNVLESGVNEFLVEELTEAQEIAQQISGKVQRKITYTMTPKGKRFPRQYTDWSDVT